MNTSGRISYSDLGGGLGNGCGPTLMGLVAIVIVSMLCGAWMGGCSGGGEVVRSDTVTVTRVDTLWHHDTVPKMIKEKVVSYVRVPVHSNSSDTGKNDAYGDSVCDGSVTLPIVQREYSDDSTYTAWVSGVLVDTIGPKLDSIIVRERVVTNEITVTNTVMKNRSRWSVGLIGGYGYGIQAKQLDFFIGAGVTYRIW